jgi:hypothetical protein
LLIAGLDSRHRDVLARFECKVYREPWTEAVEYMVRGGLADAIELGRVEAIGAWSEADQIRLSCSALQLGRPMRTIMRSGGAACSRSALVTIAAE